MMERNRAEDTRQRDYSYTSPSISSSLQLDLFVERKKHVRGRRASFRKLQDSSESIILTAKDAKVKEEAKRKPMTNGRS